MFARRVVGGRRLSLPSLVYDTEGHYRPRFGSPLATARRLVPRAYHSMIRDRTRPRASAGEKPQRNSWATGIAWRPA